MFLVKNNEPPAKGLDDYFRKTKAKPAIYWLQLTEEQVALTSSYNSSNFGCSLLKLFIQSIERALQKAQRKVDEEKGKRQADQKTRESDHSKDSVRYLADVHVLYPFEKIFFYRNRDQIIMETHLLILHIDVQHLLKINENVLHPVRHQYDVIISDIRCY